jgi:hypothetical protein
MLVFETGPGNVLHWLRVRTGISYDEATLEPLPNRWNPLYCLWCTSVYMGLLTYGLYSTGNVVAHGIVIVLALSGIACLLDVWHGKS